MKQRFSLKNLDRVHFHQTKVKKIKMLIIIIGVFEARKQNKEIEREEIFRL
jgi:hypothetical protein